jgi:hypothetical protein
MTEQLSVEAAVRPVDVLIDFLEAAVHTVLHAREIYPPYIFELRNKYNVNVFKCKHPGVIDYIQRVLANSKPIIEEVRCSDVCGAISILSTS